MKYVATVLILCLAVFLSVRACRRGDPGVSQVEVLDRYILCTNCGARYEVGPDFIAKANPEDVEVVPGNMLFRCRECGEMTGRMNIRAEMGGEAFVVGEDDNVKGDGYEN